MKRPSQSPNNNCRMSVVSALALDYVVQEDRWAFLHLHLEFYYDPDVLHLPRFPISPVSEMPAAGR
jgi:hypothetical protein